MSPNEQSKFLGCRLSALAALVALAAAAAAVIAADHEPSQPPRVTQQAEVDAAAAGGDGGGPAKRWPRLPDWRAYQRQYHKSYATLSEQLLRFQLYLANLFRVAKSRLLFSRRERAYYMALNQFSDKTPAERRRLFPASDASADATSTKTTTKTRSKRHAAADWLRQVFRPHSGGGGGGDHRRQLVDLRRDRCLPGAQLDQADCGCCYAVAGLKALEWLHCNRTAGERPLSFSVQQLVDCGRPFGLSGCRSGSLHGVQQLVGSVGLREARHWPYLARESAHGCPLNSSAADAPMGPVHRAVGLQFELLRAPARWLEALAERRQPLVVYARVPDDLLDYGGGVYEPAGCSGGGGGGHFMLLAGRQRDQRSGRHHWILQNSFGPRWGEAGYVRWLAADEDAADECLVYAARPAADSLG